jgi:NAD(P)-dependent dehydrogenase (short-subunit alcohol dehydrogenase family)
MTTRKRFEGKTALVTGAGQGIGFEICRQLAEEGATVYLNDINPELTRQAADRINAGTGRCLPVPGDCSETAFIKDTLRMIVHRSGKLDIAMANAGITLFGDFLTYRPQAFFELIKINLGGSFFLAQSAALQMKEQKTGGHILFTSSTAGHQAHKNLAAYGMTKAALEMLARQLVIELSPFHINVNAIAPGATLTERTASDAGYEQVWNSITPMGRPARPADIAHAALFLVSDEAAHITGQTLIIDGGWTAVSPSPYQ